MRNQDGGLFRRGMELCHAGERTYGGEHLLYAVPGYPYYSHHDTFLHNDYHNDDQMPQRSFYRWHIMDPVLFEEDLKVTVQQIGVYHGGLFERQDDMASVAYWYQAETSSALRKADGKKERWPR